MFFNFYLQSFSEKLLFCVPPNFCQQIQSLLSECQISVVLNGFSSNHSPNAAEIALEFMLVPTLFRLQINDLVFSIPFTIMYITGAFRLQHIIDKRINLQSILKWGRRILVQFNASKTPFCTLSCKNSDLLITDSTIL